MPSPVITIFVRHAADCKYAGDEFAKRCTCRKHLRWTHGGKQHRLTAGTRSWAEAETAKRNKEDQLAGRAPEKKQSALDLAGCVSVFIQDKQVQGVTPDVLSRYQRELDRLRQYCERHRVHAVQGLTAPVLTGYSATFERTYPSTQTRGAVRARTRSFLRYCYEAQWLERIPAMPKIAVDEPPTLPLTPDEYRDLLAAAERGRYPERVRGLFQLMRYSGLAIRDALTLPRAAIRLDEAKGVHRIVTSRQKTGTHVSVPVPPAVAKELLAIPNDTPDYIFWDGSKDIVKTWTKYMVLPAFKEAKIAKEGSMMSHRLRDTFAVDLLEKGVPMEEVSRLLGHTSIRTTEKSYAKWSKGRQDRVDALVSGTWDSATRSEACS